MLVLTGIFFPEHWQERVKQVKFPHRFVKNVMKRQATSLFFHAVAAIIQFPTVTVSFGHLN